MKRILFRYFMAAAGIAAPAVALPAAVFSATTIQPDTAVQGVLEEPSSTLEKEPPTRAV